MKIKFTLMLIECPVFPGDRNMLFNSISKVCTMFLRFVKLPEICMAFRNRNMIRMFSQYIYL